MRQSNSMWNRRWIALVCVVAIFCAAMMLFPADWLDYGAVEANLTRVVQPFSTTHIPAVAPDAISTTGFERGPPARG